MGYFTLADILIDPNIITQNIMQFVKDSAVSASAKYQSPDKFDPNSLAVSSWFRVTVPAIKQYVGRVATGLVFEGTIRCEVFARSQTATQAHMKLAADIQDALCHEGFQVIDYQSVGTPVVGFCSIYEPDLRERANSQPYQQVVLTMKFKVERTA